MEEFLTLLSAFAGAGVFTFLLKIVENIVNRRNRLAEADKTLAEGGQIQSEAAYKWAEMFRTEMQDIREDYKKLLDLHYGTGRKINKIYRAVNGKNGDNPNDS